MQPFIRGETLDLYAPSKEAIAQGWGQWFNDPEVTKWLNQGVFPNTGEEQADRIRSKDRLTLMIHAKDEALCGVISLSDIRRASAQIALVVPHRPHPLMALEAMARLTAHAFEKLGVRVVSAGQAYPGLSKWTGKLELIGYRSDGLQRLGFIKGRTESDIVLISCTAGDYDALVRLRGTYWPGAEYMSKLMKCRENMCFADRIRWFMQDEGAAYFADLDATERKMRGEPVTAHAERDLAQERIFGRY